MTAVKAYQFDSFLASLKPNTPGILFYGPNDGLVDELIKQTIDQTLGEQNDRAFSLTSLHDDTIKNKPSIVAEEAEALSFLGGPRVVLISQSLDSLAKHLEHAFSVRSDNTLIIVRAGILSPRSTLRNLFEKDKNIFAVPCYEDNPQSLKKILSLELSKENISLSPKIHEWILNALSPDRRHARQQIEKLILLAGEEKSIHEQHIQLILEQADKLTIDTLIDTAFSGQKKILSSLILSHRHLNDLSFNMRVVRAGSAHVATLRTLFRLLSLENRSFKDALSHVQPRIFFKREPLVQKQCKLWNHHQKLHKASEIFLATEQRIKNSPSIPSHVLVERALLSLAQTSLKPFPS
jgi:DNA polymerase-3 subunit delta